MANVFNEHTMLWTVTETGKLSAAEPTASAASLLNPIIGDLIFVPAVVGDNVTIQDGTAVEDAIILKAGASDISPVHKSFRPQGRRITNPDCTVIDGGTLYVYLM